MVGGASGDIYRACWTDDAGRLAYLVRTLVQVATSLAWVILELGRKVLDLQACSNLCQSFGRQRQLWRK
jgi:hypothetical protein